MKAPKNSRESSQSHDSVPAPASHLRWADLIKSHHHEIQEKWSTAAAEDEGEALLGIASSAPLSAGMTHLSHDEPKSSHLDHEEVKGDQAGPSGEGLSCLRAEAAHQDDDDPHHGCPARRRKCTMKGREREEKWVGAGWDDPVQLVKQWEHLLESPELKKRRVQYAVAMHHLATTYWEQPPAGVQHNTPAEGVGERPCCCGVTSSVAHQDQEPGPRGASHTHPTTTSTIRRAGGGGSRNLASLRRRRYDDRVQLCLDCLAAYFLGTPNKSSSIGSSSAPRARKDDIAPPSPFSPPSTGEADHPAVASPANATPPQPTTGLTSPLHHSAVLFGSQTPPMIFATVSKTMRRHFFQAHHRMATPREVEHIMWGVPLNGGGLQSNEKDSMTAGTHCPFPEWCVVCGPLDKTDKTASTLSSVAMMMMMEDRHAPAVQLALLRNGGTCGGMDGNVANTAYDQARQYIQRRLTALQIHSPDNENCRRRSVVSVSEPPPSSGTARTTSNTSAVAASTPPPPLHILDVGSCYGPFHGACLGTDDRVPLVVTSLDLEPYHDPSLGDEMIPAVLAADWLTTPVEYVATPSSTATATGTETSTATDGPCGGTAVPRFATGTEGVPIDANGEEGEHNNNGSASWIGMKTIPHRTPFTALDASVGEGHSSSSVWLDDCRVEVKLEDSDFCALLAADHDKNKNKDKIEETEAAEGGEGWSGVGRSRRRYRVVRIAAESYDGVIFCLLLSYLPSPPLRFLACLNAFLALKEGGLLVLLSTRTQGSRRVPWVEEWITTIETIGFERVHVQTREKIVVLSFKKRSDKSIIPAPSRSLSSLHQTTGHSGGDGGRRVDEKFGRDTSRSAVEEWKRRMLNSPAAHSGLKITADHQL